MTQKTITYHDEKFVLKTFFDVDTSTEGIDVSTEGKKHIGEMWGETLPDKLDNEFYTEELNSLKVRVGQWLEENYFNS